MLPFTKHGEGGPIVVMLHWLGGSSKTWSEVAEGLAGRGFTCIAIDLPGFGRAVDMADTGVDVTVRAVIETIALLRKQSVDPWFLAGHSMGGKLAMIVARASIDGYPGLERLQGLILVSPSPPSAEPMEESTRRRMLKALGECSGDPVEDRDHAEGFVDDNTGKLPLEASVRARAVDDVLRMSRGAFSAWLTTGSKEDWAERVGAIPIPALILAGSEEPALGPEAQKRLTQPHLPKLQVVTLEGGGHLGPLERPAELVDRVVDFVQGLVNLPTPASSALPDDFRALVDSELTSPQTRAVLNARIAEADCPAATTPLSPRELLVLRAIARRILPDCPFDLAACVQSWLTLPTHDGWRHDSLPPDLEAWQVGLHSIDSAALRAHGVPFFALHSSLQDTLLGKAGEGRLSGGLFHSLHIDSSGAIFTGPQMADWFGDLCGEFTKMYMADPRVMSRIEFTGFADEAGFTKIRLDERESFER